MDATLRAFLPVLAGILAIAGLGVGAAFLALRGRKPELAREIGVRYLAWLVMAALVVGALVAGRAWWIAFVGLLSGVAFREYARAVGLWRERGFLAVEYALLAIVTLVVWWPYPTEPSDPGGTGWYGLFVVMPVWGILFLLLVPVVRGQYEHMLQRLALAIVGFVYLVWMLAHLGFLANVAGGIGLILFLVFLVAVNDVGAFVVGKLAGRHKLRPLLSPGKTWEGALGGVAITMAAGYALAWLVPMFPLAHVVAISALIGVAGTVGDLALATIKRDLGLKDWGHLIPGHGGALDRLNSLVFAAPMFFHYTRYFFL